MSDLHVAESSKVNPEFWVLFIVTVRRLNISNYFGFNNIKKSNFQKTFPFKNIRKRVLNLSG